MERSFNCLRMRFVKIGTDNEMPGRIKLSQPGRDNLPFRAGICGEIGGKYVVAISGPRGASSTRPAMGQGLLSGGSPDDDGACEKNNEKDRREAHRRAVLRFPQRSGAPSSSPAQFLRGASCPCSSRSSLQPRFVVARRAANGLDLVRNTRTGPVAICTSRSGLIKGIVMSG